MENWGEQILMQRTLHKHEGRMIHMGINENATLQLKIIMQSII